MTTITIRTIATSALLLAFTLSGLGSRPALAASSDVKSPRDVATGQASGKRQYAPIIIRKYTDIEASLAALRAQMATLQTQCDELSALAAEAEAAGAEEGAAAAELLTQLETAQQVFADQVAALLDPELSAQVTTALQGLTTQAHAIGHFEDGQSSSETEDVQVLLDTLAALQADLDPVAQAAAKGKEAATKSSSNIQNN